MSSGQVELGVPVEHGEQFPVQVEIHGRVAGRTLVAGMIQFVKYVELNIRRVIIFCRVFQPFFRVDKSRSREYGGVGLGLSLVWEIVALHNGKIRVEESSEKGTAIAVKFPTDVIKI